MPAPQSTHRTFPGSYEGGMVAGNGGGCGGACKTPCLAQSQAHRGHCCQGGGEAPSPGTHRGQKQRRGNDPGVLLFPSWCSSLGLGGLCRAAGPAPSCSVSGTPKVSPYLRTIRTLPAALPRGVPLSSHSAVPCPGQAESLPLGAQVYRHPVLAAGDSSVCADIQSSEALASASAHQGWAADQGCKQRPLRRAGLSSVFFTLEGGLWSITPAT